MIRLKITQVSFCKSIRLSVQPFTSSSWLSTMPLTRLDIMHVSPTYTCANTNSTHALGLNDNINDIFTVINWFKIYSPIKSKLMVGNGRNEVYTLSCLIGFVNLVCSSVSKYRLSYGTRYTKKLLMLEYSSLQRLEVITLHRTSNKH